MCSSPQAPQGSRILFMRGGAKRKVAGESQKCETLFDKRLLGYEAVVSDESLVAMAVLLLLSC